MFKRRRRCVVLRTETLETRCLLTGITGFGIAGDSLSDEYAATTYNYAHNWDELLSSQEGLNFGPVGSFPAPRNTGFEFNWAEFGATSTDLLTEGQDVGLAAQIDAGLVSHAVLAIGANDFRPDLTPYQAIATGAWTATDIQNYSNLVVSNITTALTTLYNTNAFLAVSNIPDYGIAPITQANFNAVQRQRVTDVIDAINARLETVADSLNVPLIDTNGITRVFYGTNSAPTPAWVIGGVTITNTPGVGVTNAFVDDGIHPHTIVQAQIANLFLTAFNKAYGTPVDLFTEAESVALIGQTYGGVDTLNVDFPSFIHLPNNTAPVLGSIPASSSFMENAASQRIAPNATLTDADNLNFAQGSITVQISGNADVNDRLAIVNQGTGAGQIGAVSGVLSLGGITIGSYSGGSGATPLTILLNNKANASAVQAVLRTLTFQTLGDNPSSLTRTLSVAVTDGDGGASDVLTKDVSVVSLNDAPSLNTTGNPTLSTIVEDAANPNGTPIGNLINNIVTDNDGIGALKGIAVITAGGTTGGIWQFTLDGGADWQALGAVAETSARLLPVDGTLSRVRFLPNPNFNGTVNLIYRAWDQTQGTAGAAFDLTGKYGGVNAFSTSFETATQTVTAVNDAPVVNNAGSPTLNTIAEDTTNPGGNLVSSLVTGVVSDVDANALAGIAVVGAGNANGAWQFSLDNGVNWQAMGTVSETAARLLPSDSQTRVRFVPNANFNGALNFTYRGWDRTQGTAAGTFNLTGNYGGTKAFSSAFEVATLTVTPVNDAPTLNTAPNPTLATIVEDATNPAGSLITSFATGAISDVDAGALKGIAVITAGGSTAGHWQFSLNNGASWSELGSPAETSARLLAGDANTRVRFLPNANFNGSVNLLYRAWDRTQGTAGGTLDLTGKYGGTNAFSTAFESASLTVTPVNDAPVLNTSTSFALNSIAEDATNPGGTPVTNLLRTAVTDVDANAVRGLAITGAPAANGAWEFSTDNGATWQPMGAVSDSSARLLAADANTRVRFIPAANFNGNVPLSYRAWDQTQGTVGGTFNVTGNTGGTKAFSTNVLTATQTVTPVNDKPVLGGISGSIGYTHNAAAIAIAPTATVTDIDSQNFNRGKLTVRMATLDTANQLAIGGGFTVDTTNNQVWLGAITTGTLIGTLTSSGKDGTNLVVTFNAAATVSIVQQLVTSITYRTTTTSPTTRTVFFSVVDDGNATSVEVSKNINIA
jgi:hypothetical protein